MIPGSYLFLLYTPAYMSANRISIAHMALPLFRFRGALEKGTTNLCVCVL